MRAANPAAVFVFYPGAWGVQWVKQYSQAGLDKTIPLYSAFTLDEVSIQAIGDAAVGMFSASHWVADIDNPANARFVRDYRAKYGRQPSGYAAQGYDSLQLIASAVEGVKGICPRSRRRATRSRKPISRRCGAVQVQQQPLSHPEFLPHQGREEG